MKDRLTIGVLIGNANSPYSLNLIGGIREEAEAQNVDVICFLGVHNGPAYRVYFGTEEAYNYDYQFNSNYDNIALTNVDALVIDYNSMVPYMEDNEPIQFLEKFKDIPYVLVGDRDPSGKGSSIVFDCYQGMCQLTEHLVVKHGFRRIAMLSGPMGNRDAEVRLTAVRDTMQKYGLPLGEKQIAYGDFTRVVKKQVNRLLDDNPGLEALICANDFMAATACQVCRERGLSVGQDIAVTGYDDWVNAKMMDPPLTTVRQNEVVFGRKALECAVRYIRTGVPTVESVPVDFCLRASCGCEAVWQTPEVPDFRKL